jgi:hypothetical protein
LYSSVQGVDACRDLVEVVTPGGLETKARRRLGGTLKLIADFGDEQLKIALTGEDRSSSQPPYWSVGWERWGRTARAAAAAPFPRTRRWRSQPSRTTVTGRDARTDAIGG